MHGVWPLSEDLIKIGGNAGFVWTATAAIYYSDKGQGYRGPEVADRHVQHLVDELGRLRGHLANATWNVDAMLRELESRDEAKVKRQRTSYNLTGAASSWEAVDGSVAAPSHEETNASNPWEGALGPFFKVTPGESSSPRMASVHSGDSSSPVAVVFRRLTISCGSRTRGESRPLHHAHHG